jgi:hypothetical protein
LFSFLACKSEARVPASDNKYEVNELKGVLPAVYSEKPKHQKKKKVGDSKPKAFRKLRFTNPFMLLNPLISHLLFLSPSKQSNDTLGA